MKKILSAVLAAATLSTAVPALATNGGNWYAGVQLGAAFNRTKFTATRGNASSTQNKSKTSMPVGLQLGWMCSMPNNFFYAVEVGAFYDVSHNTKSSQAPGGVTGSATLKKRWALEFMPKLGYQFNNDWAAYILAAITGTSFKLSVDRVGDTTKFAGGIAPGAGAMFIIDTQWTANVEYKYQIHQKIEKSGTVSGVAISGKAEPRAHVITAKLNYAFA